MSDPFNVALGEDPQSKSAIHKAEEQKRLSSTTLSGSPRKGSFTDKQKEEKDGTLTTSISVLYEEGIQAFKIAGFSVVADHNGDFCKHRIERGSRPKDIKGVNYPAWFKPSLPVTSPDDLKHLEYIINGQMGGMSAEAKDLWRPLVHPVRGETDLELYAVRILSLEKASESKDPTVTLLQTFDPTGVHLGRRAPSPRAWIPAKEWFAPQLHNVRFEDVFTIFPKAENKILELILGRIGVGPSHQVPANGGDPIVHTSRSAAVIVGKDAGLGKSTTFDGLNSALTMCGFNVSTFRNTSERFGMKDIALSHVAYKDDTAMKTLRTFLSAEETKIMITGGLIHTEEKFQTAESVKSRTVIIANSNDWDPNFMYDIDSGIMDRIKVLSTYRESELVRRTKTIGGVSAGSPDLHPFNHIPWLANKLGVDEAALFLWCARLAADRFYGLITSKESKSGNALKDEVQMWSASLRIRWHANINSSIASAMTLSMAMRDPSRRATELSPATLLDFLKAFYFVGTDPSCYDLVEQMKRDWKEAGCPSNHYYTGFKEIRWETAKMAIEKGVDSLHSNYKLSYSDFIKEVLGVVSLRDGFKVSQSHVHMASVWQSTRIEEQDLRDKAEQYLSTLPEEYRNRVRSKEDSYDSWLLDDNYSPDRAEEFRGAAKGSDKFVRILSKTTSTLLPLAT